MTETITCSGTPMAKSSENIAQQRQYRPLVDILEGPDAIEIKADLPGVKQGDIEVTFESGLLTIFGKVLPRQPQTQTYVTGEYSTGDFRRSFVVDVPIDADAIAAQLKHGELTVRLPKTELARTKKVPVSVG